MPEHVLVHLHGIGKELDGSKTMRCCCINNLYQSVQSKFLHNMRGKINDDRRG